MAKCQLMLCLFAVSPWCRLFYSRMVGCGQMLVDVVLVCCVTVVPFVLQYNGRVWPDVS